MIKYSHTKERMMLAAVAFFYITVFKMLYDYHIKDILSGDKNSIVWVIFVVSSMIYLLRKALLYLPKTRVSMRLDDAGITYPPIEKHWGTSFIPWVAISHTTVFRFGKGECLMIHLSNANVCVDYSASKIHRMFYGDSITVNVKDLEGTAKSISNRIEEFRSQVTVSDEH